jgi:hypothetical protein
LLSDLVEALKAADVIFIYIFVERSTEGDVAPNTRNPLVDATLNLHARPTCYKIMEQKGDCHVLL